MSIKIKKRYRAYIKELERAEFIETKSLKNETNDKVIIETKDPVKRKDLPDHLGNKVDIYS